jgi:Uma2 family endonuclease
MKEKDDLELREPVIAYGKKTFSIEEYLAYENASPEKHEYYHGEIFAMAGAGNKHNAIFVDFLVGLGNALKGSACFPLGSDMRLHIPSNTLFTYPDISVYCKDTISMFSDTTATLPTVLIEILSPSTRNIFLWNRIRFQLTFTGNAQIIVGKWSTTLPEIKI